MSKRKIKINAKEHKLNVLVARSWLQKAKGLSWRNDMELNECMLFDMNKTADHRFNTHKMKFNIDMVALFSDGEVFEIWKDVKKGEDVTLHGHFILEGKAGFIDKYKIKVGKVIKIDGLIK